MALTGLVHLRQCPLETVGQGVDLALGVVEAPPEFADLVHVPLQGPLDRPLDRGFHLARPPRLALGLGDLLAQRGDRALGERLEVVLGTLGDGDEMAPEARGVRQQVERLAIGKGIPPALRREGGDLLSGDRRERLVASRLSRKTGGDIRLFRYSAIPVQAAFLDQPQQIADMPERRLELARPGGLAQRSGNAEKAGAVAAVDRRRDRAEQVEGGLVDQKRPAKDHESAVQRKRRDVRRHPQFKGLGIVAGAGEMAGAGREEPVGGAEDGDVRQIAAHRNMGHSSSASLSHRGKNGGAK